MDRTALEGGQFEEEGPRLNLRKYSRLRYNEEGWGERCQEKTVEILKRVVLQRREERGLRRQPRAYDEAGLKLGEVQLH